MSAGWPGVALALAAYCLWGLLPVYWSWLEQVDAREVLAHRILWTVPCMALLVAWRGGTGRLLALRHAPGQLLTLLGTALLIAANWGIYIWAIHAGRVLECSLGYFLMPLFNVLAGMAFFAERLRPWQWLAVGLAGAGLANQLLAFGSLPWIGLALALTFVAYGALRKRARVDAPLGLLVEALLLAPLALFYVLWLAGAGAGAFARGAPGTDALLVLAGVVTALPLALHVAATRRLALKDVGLLFYLTPSLQFLLGVLVYEETVDVSRLSTFVLIWTALAVYTAEQRLIRRRALPPAGPRA